MCITDQYVNGLRKPKEDIIALSLTTCMFFNAINLLLSLIGDVQEVFAKTQHFIIHQYTNVN